MQRPPKVSFLLSSQACDKKLTGSEGKRSKLETETSRSTRSSSRDQHERTVPRRPSSVQPEIPAMGGQRSHVSPPLGPMRLPAGPSHSSKPTSPSVHTLSGLNSPRTLDQFSPISASPRSVAKHRENFIDASSSNTGRELRGTMDNSMLYHAPAYGTDSFHQPAIATPPSYPYNAHYQPSHDLPPRRTIQGSARLPPLSREDTTLSSESGHSGRSISLAPLPGHALPLDTAKTYRMLPQPIPNLGPLQSPLDRPPPPLIPIQQHQIQSHDYRTQGSLAVLLRAGELAAADDETMEEGSP